MPYWVNFYIVCPDMTWLSVTTATGMFKIQLDIFCSSFLYPEPVKPLDVRQVDGQYEVFTLVEKTVKLNLSKIISSENNAQPTESLLSGAIAMALCYIARMQRKKVPGVKVWINAY